MKMAEVTRFLSFGARVLVSSNFTEDSSIISTLEKKETSLISCSTYYLLRNLTRFGPLVLVQSCKILYLSMSIISNTDPLVILVN